MIKRIPSISIDLFCKPKSTCILDAEPLQSPKLNRLGIGKPKEWEKN